MKTIIKIDEDDLASVIYAIREIGHSVVPGDCAPGTDATGGTVRSLAEAVMGITSGLHEVALALSEIADSIKSLRQSNEP